MSKEGFEIPLLSSIPGFPSIPSTGVPGLDGVFNVATGIVTAPLNLVGGGILGGLTGGLSGGGGSSDDNSGYKPQPGAPVNKNDQIAAIKDKLLREYHESKIANNVTAQQLCCAHDSRLRPYSIQDKVRSETNDVFALAPDLTPKEYCGEYWDRGGACDVTMKNYCNTYPTDDICSCITGTQDDPNDSEAAKIYKRSPFCFNPTCQSYGYKPSRYNLEQDCPNVQFCDQNLYSNGENNAIVSTIIKQKCGDSVETTPEGTIVPAEQPLVSGVDNTVLYIIIFVMFVMLALILYKMSKTKAVTGGFDSIMGGFSDIVNNLKSGLSSAANQAISKTKNELSSNLSGIANEAKSNLTGAVNQAISNTANELKAVANDNINRATNELNNTIDNTSGRLTNTVNNAIGGDTSEMDGVGINGMSLSDMY